MATSRPTTSRCRRITRSAWHARGCASTPVVHVTTGRRAASAAAPARVSRRPIGSPGPGMRWHRRRKRPALERRTTGTRRSRPCGRAHGFVERDVPSWVVERGDEPRTLEAGLLGDPRGLSRLPTSTPSRIAPRRRGRGRPVSTPRGRRGADAGEPAVAVGRAGERLEVDRHTERRDLGAEPCARSSNAAAPRT